MVAVAALTSFNPPQNPASAWRRTLLPPNAAFCSPLLKKKNKPMSWSFCAHSLPFDLSPPPIDHDFLKKRFSCESFYFPGEFSSLSGNLCLFLFSHGSVLATEGSASVSSPQQEAHENNLNELLDEEMEEMPEIRSLRIGKWPLTSSEVTLPAWKKTRIKFRIDAIGNYGHHLKVPSYNEFRSPLLKKELEYVKGLLRMLFLLFVSVSYCETEPNDCYTSDGQQFDSVKTAGTDISGEGIIEIFHNDDEALDAVDNGVVVVDLSHFGRIRVSGEDRIQFLHNQSTANFECLHEAQGCDTVFVTPTARTIDIAHAWIMKNAVTLVVSPETCRTITEMLNKYIFLADKVEIQDITKQTSFFVMVGPKSGQVMENLNIGDLVGKPYGTHQHFNVDKELVTIGVGNIISEGGFSLLMSPAAAPSIWKAILTQGAIPMGSNAWNKLRIIRGRPAPGMELTDEFNVLEACLWSSVSLNKGCYKGQETISRLITYDGIKQRLWGIHLSAAAEPGSIITIDGKKVGKLTSYTPGRKQSEHFGLGYIKRRAASEGDVVVVADNIKGTVVEVPFLSQQCPPSAS
ncbi:unnamed protein product [Sphenostylis stenocarpa]|uniref:GCVT N-terminal domain-containing protein n=1 Tax=Sphenostylis stenocarpa TaxID=92480 RepID=A0AA86S139_9FABA|nr:unnamed protein product [Sphenostylis stenocarpa]